MAPTRVLVVMLSHAVGQGKAGRLVCVWTLSPCLLSDRPADQGQDYRAKRNRERVIHAFVSACRQARQANGPRGLPGTSLLKKSLQVSHSG
jgi:hypothetical protein